MTVFRGSMTKICRFDWIILGHHCCLWFHKQKLSCQFFRLVLKPTYMSLCFPPDIGFSVRGFRVRKPVTFNLIQRRQKCSMRLRHSDLLFHFWNLSNGFVWVRLSASQLQCKQISIIRSLPRLFASWSHAISIPQHFADCEITAGFISFPKGRRRFFSQSKAFW